jgi:hypothetical protein
MGTAVKCPVCGKKNELIDFDNFRYPFQKLPDAARNEIIRLSDAGKKPGIMLCSSCQAFGVFPIPQ